MSVTWEAGPQEGEARTCIVCGTTTGFKLLPLKMIQTVQESIGRQPGTDLPVDQRFICVELHFYTEITFRNHLFPFADISQRPSF